MVARARLMLFVVLFPWYLRVSPNRLRDTRSISLLGAEGKSAVRATSNLFVQRLRCIIVVIRVSLVEGCANAASGEESGEAKTRDSRAITGTLADFDSESRVTED